MSLIAFKQRNFVVNEMAQWLEHQAFGNFIELWFLDCEFDSLERGFNTVNLPTVTTHYLTLQHLAALLLFEIKVNFKIGVPKFKITST